MQQPRNRQEFMRMQEQAVAAARAAQRKSRFPEQARAPKPVAPAQKPRRHDGMHHKSPRRNQTRNAPWQEAPKVKREEPNRRQQFWQEPPPQEPKSRRQEQKFQPPPGKNHRAGNRNQGQNRNQGCRRQEQGRDRAQPPSQQTAPPPPPAQQQAPGLTELFSMFGGMGEKPGARAKTRDCDGFGDEGSMDSVLVILLMFLLQKEKADQGLMMALMYIMM